MRARWYYTPAYYIVGLLFGLFLSIIINLFTHSLNMDWLLSLESFSTVLMLGFSSLPAIVFWAVLTIINRAIESKSERAVIALPLVSGTLFVVVGLYLVLPGLLNS